VLALAPPPEFDPLLQGRLELISHLIDESSSI
jgi:hypothetical protein